MGFYRFADRIFEINNKYDYLDRLCADYAVEEQEPNFVVEVSDDEIMAESEGDAAKFPPPYLESLAIYRKIAECLSAEDCMLMHAAVIEYEGKAYAFMAKSGTGKTTHISLWEKVFGDKVKVINGDKPLIRILTQGGNTSFIAYGTPWCGKEKKGLNKSSVLGGICILERSVENFIVPIGAEAIPFIMGQILMKNDAEYIGRMMSFTDRLIKNVPIYRLGVNMDESAAIVARDGLCK
ncbi:MAG: hypothetical protein E7671_04145 [Ruminococcaceae bacterium]|nr:hypothetical protein [Oscillospiraceae bacterium]